LFRYVIPFTRSQAHTCLTAGGLRHINNKTKDPWGSGPLISGLLEVGTHHGLDCLKLGRSPIHQMFQAFLSRKDIIESTDDKVTINVIIDFITETHSSILVFIAVTVKVLKIFFIL